MAILIKVIIFFSGLSIGSFAYAFSFRFPRKISWISGRSQCEKCKKNLKWQELIPVFSFLIQKGKCRNCKEFIGFGYLFSELSIAISFLFLWNNFSINPHGNYLLLLFKTAFLILFFILAFIDLKYFIIPDRLLILGAVLAVVFKFYSRPILPVWSYLIVAIISGGALFLIWLVSEGKWLGLGDAKLISLIGFIFGFPGILFVFYLAVSLGVLISIYLFIFKKANRKTPLPFGTFLSISSIIYLIFSSRIDSFLFKILL